jgi:molybdate transport system permease protein
VPLLLLLVLPLVALVARVAPEHVVLGLRTRSAFYVKAAMTGLMNVDRELEQAAMIDGANRLEVLRFITLPLIQTALLSGAVMTWARALGEFGATIIFAGNFPGRTQTMPLAIYLGFELDIDVALALSAILLAVSFGILFLIKRVLRQRPERI